MPKLFVAEGGRVWPDHPCGPEWVPTCTPNDVDAWGRRLTAEIQATQTHVSELSPAGEWIGSAAAALAAEIAAWEPNAREWADTARWHDVTAVPIAYYYDGYPGVVQEIVNVISAGDDLNQRARVMLWEWRHQAAPLPFKCPDGYTPVTVAQADGTLVQVCQGTAPAPVPVEELEKVETSGGGGLLLFAAITAASVGAIALYSRRRT